jgi:hypothetical protein
MEAPGPWAVCCSPEALRLGLRQPLLNAAAIRPQFTRLAVMTDSTRIPATHWKAGALIGGGLLGVLGAAAGVQLACYDGPCHNRLLGALLGFSLGGLTGFGIGALIGGQFPAPPR